MKLTYAPNRLTYKPSYQPAAMPRYTHANIPHFDSPRVSLRITPHSHNLEFHLLLPVFISDADHYPIAQTPIHGQIKHDVVPRQGYNPYTGQFTTHISWRRGDDEWIKRGI